MNLSSQKAFLKYNCHENIDIFVKLFLNTNILIMKKNLIWVAAILSLSLQAQVGINISQPAATLDITAKNETGNSNNVDGILIPRIDRQRAQRMINVPVSTLIYVNSISTGTAGGIAVNIDTTGYYYFNGIAWVKLQTEVQDSNVYNTNGLLTGNRIVNQGANTIAFTSSASVGSHHFSIDGTTFSVNAASNSVGIGSSTPQKNLHINGSLQVTNELNVGGTASTEGSPGSAGQFLKSSGAGVPPVWENFAGSDSSSTGTIIIIDGRFMVAQEIVVQLTADFTTTQNGVAVRIGNLNSEIVDNEDLYNGSPLSNSFMVSETGVYQVQINAEINTENNGTGPVIGIWDDTINEWVARISDEYTAHTTGLQTYNFATSIPMDSSHMYSFRVASSASFLTIRRYNGNVGGRGPKTQMSLRRLR
jgi:hypothetical protein